jgi:L-fuconate dehydratase
MMVGIEVSNVRFPTSRELDGSDAMNPAPDYSAAYVTVRTSAGDTGHALAFTVGRAIRFTWKRSRR